MTDARTTAVATSETVRPLILSLSAPPSEIAKALSALNALQSAIRAVQLTGAAGNAA